MSPNRIDEMFDRKKREGKKAAVFFLTAGYPNLRISEQVVIDLAESGADIIELGIPFSDPIADGPTIQKASQVALEHGMTVAKVFELTRNLRAKKIKTPLVLFSAYNPILNYGLTKFAAEAASAGADALLVPDLPPEEAGDLIIAARKNELHLIFLIAPTTTRERCEYIASYSGGFIYYISLRGVTGARSELPPDITPKVSMIKEVTNLPIVVGFGVSQPEHVRALTEVADGFVVGSALINLIDQHAGSKTLSEEVRSFVKNLVAAMPTAKR